MDDGNYDTRNRGEAKEKGLDMDLDNDAVFIDKYMGEVETWHDKDPRGERENPFRRRTTLTRTPPQRRALSLTDEGRKQGPPLAAGTKMGNEESKTKRPREDSEDDLKELKKMFGKLKNVINDLTKEVQQNTRVEIKKGIKVAKGQADDIVRMWDALTLQMRGDKKSRSETLARETQAESAGTKDAHMQTRLEKLEGEVKALNKEMEQLKAENTKLKEDLKICGKALPGNVTEDMLNGREKSWENFKLTTELKWPRSLYKNAFPVAGPLWEAGSDTDLLLLMESGTGAEKNKGIRNALESRYPEVREDEDERVAAKITTSFKDRDGKRASISRWILRAEAEEDDRVLFDQLVEIQKIMKDGGRSKLAMYPPGKDPQGGDTRKMLEYIFRDSGIKCFMHVKHSEGRKKNVNNEARQLTRGAPRKSDALVLRQEGKSYAELLRLVKGTVQPGSQAAKAVKNVRKTRDGGMLILLEQTNREDRELLKAEIAKVHGGKIHERGPADEATSFRISEIDGETSKDEVVAAIRTVLGEAADELTLIDLKPSFGENQVATVRVGKEGTPILNGTERIRIGLSSCPVREKVEVMRCYRCWGYGHRRFQCTGKVDYSEACARCGEKDHLANDCNKSERCLTCKREGHRAGSGRCPEFRKAVSRERLLKKKKKAY